MLINRFFSLVLGLSLMVTAALSAKPLSATQLVKGVPSTIQAAVTHKDRTAEDINLDAIRKPATIMDYMGIKTGDYVADLGTGTGYYAELLARVVGKTGKIYAVNNDYVINQIGNDVIEGKSKNPDLSHLVVRQQELDELTFDAPLDAVFLMLFYHDVVWQDTDRAKMNKAIFDALKPGGIFAITDHRAEAGSGTRDAKILHRIDEAMVRAEVEAAGFILIGQSNALTTREDRNNVSVFAPAIRGKTNRFVYKFQKPLSE